MTNIQPLSLRHGGPWLQGELVQEKDGDDCTVHQHLGQDEPHGVHAEQGLLRGLQEADASAWPGQLWILEIFQ